MSGKHPNLHPKLDNFNIFNSFAELVSSEEKSISFLEEIDLIPSRQSTPPQCCGLPMLVVSDTRYKFNWVWRCSSKG
ncbi:unnamed protein product [Euphydryas editha]|uniref:Uncharacterized protein n=1 Tax=Euphydryas editha TaxID=104508 RepID=A0AAU9UN03_EUPED|nr:unnamed protein product [Euphydryas editha]